MAKKILNLTKGRTHGEAACGQKYCHGTSCSVKASAALRHAQAPSIIDFSGFDLKKISRTEVKALGNSYLGVFAKYTSSVNGSLYIVKTFDKRFPKMAEIEFLSNHIGRLLGLNVAEFSLGRVADGSTVFASRSFIEESSHSNLCHFDTIMDDGAEWDCESIIKSIKENSSNPKEDCETFVKMCLFDSLIGNMDRHKQNIGMIVGDSEVRLSPTYDNVSSVYADPKLHSTQNIEIPGYIGCRGNKDPLLSDYIEELGRLGFSSEVEGFVDLIKRTDFDDLVSSSGILGVAADSLLKQIKFNKRGLE